MSFCACGRTSVNPNAAIINIEMKRRLVAGMPVKLTIVERNRVKKVKLNTKPVTMPNGRFLPPMVVVLRIIGRMGRIHGERIVTTPPIKLNIKRISILSF